MEAVEQDSDRTTGGQHKELGHVTDEHGRSQGLGLSQLIPNCRPMGCGLLSPNPSPIAKFLPTGSMGRISMFICLEEKSLGWWVRNSQSLGPGQDTWGMLQPCKPGTG